jgi:hypothetical protein
LAQSPSDLTAMTFSRSSFVALITVASLAMGCVSTTQIQSQPSGAEIVMDNTIKLGRTPIEFREMVWVWTNRRFEARMPGYQSQVFYIQKQYPWAQNLVVCLCTGLILWPVLLASEYVDQTMVQLIPAGSAELDGGIVEQPELAFDSSK